MLKTYSHNYFFYFITFNLFWYSASVLADDCQIWFDQQGLNKGKDCLIECSIAETDMGTFHCSERCIELCREKIKEELYLTLSKVYPTLTEAERDLIAKYPKKMLLSYKISWESENLCLTLYERSKTNDESDACRHFVWAILLYKNLDFNLSQKILDAHEQNQEQPVEQKSMDLANNRLGLTKAIYLKRNNKLNKKEILKSFQKNLKDGNLVVLKPGARKAPKKSVTKNIWNKLKREENYKKSNQKEEQ